MEEFPATNVLLANKHAVQIPVPRRDHHFAALPALEIRFEDSIQYLQQQGRDFLAEGQRTGLGGASGEEGVGCCDDGVEAVCAG